MPRHAPSSTIKRSIAVTALAVMTLGATACSSDEPADDYQGVDEENDLGNDEFQEPEVFPQTETGTDVIDD